MVSQSLVAALAGADPAAVAACFTEDARLRSLNPPGLNERHGAAEIGELMASWFADCTEIELLASSSESIADREHVTYRFAAIKEGRGHCLMEQHLYAEMDGARFADVALVCSGFRPTPRQV